MSAFIIKQGDTSPSIAYTLYHPDGETKVNVTGATVKFILATEATLGTPKVKADAAIVDAVNGEVRYDWSDGDTDAHGEFVAEWEVTFQSGKVETYPNRGFIPVFIPQAAG